MRIVSPVVPGLENYEIQIGGKEAGQEQYEALPALRSPEGVVLTRWEPTDDERHAIAIGADIFISVLTFNHPFQPIKVDVGGTDDPNLVPETKRSMRLDDDFELRSLLADFNRATQELQEKQLAFLKSNEELKKLAEATQRARALLDRKKQEVFSDKPSPIQIVN